MEVVSVATGVMKPLLSKLTKLLGEEYVKFKGVRKQIRFLRDELSAMSATLEVLADVEQLNPEVRLWRDKLRELAYDLEDCIDAFMARVDQGYDGHTGFIKKFFHMLKRSKARHEIANQIEELKARLKVASDMRKRYDSGQLQNNPGMSSVDPRLQVLYEDIENLVGIDGPKKHIIELLTTEMNGSSSKLKVVSIAGCGGLGKTTLAKQVYDTIKVQFSCSAFVSVSRTPDARKILIHISDGVGSTGYTRDDDEQQLIDKLREHLQDERYLIVIDDIWDEKPWEIIKLALVNKNCGSRVIITTRSTAVASRLSSQGGNVYQLKSLSFEDSKRLLFKRAFGSENSSFAHLGSVPDEILKKCDGLPLAIITISSMLADKHAKCEWERVLSDIGSALANNPGAEKMTTILSMSYFDMPHHLRTCLLYLSVFPEDYQIEKRCLINRWTAEGGFIGEEKGLTKYEIGEGYFNDLINRSMIQPVDIMDGQAKACRVHDIILDYIKCRAVEVNFVTILDDDAEHIYASKHKVRRLCVSNRSKELASLLTSSTLSHVRSLMISGFLPVKTSLLPSTALRVLDLGDCYGMNDHHLASIEKLFHLKYLRLHSHLITKLPEKIGELRYLQTLDVRGTSIKELPPTIGELRYLQTLDVRGTSIKELAPTITKLQRLAYLYFDNEVRFPDGMIGQMHGLEELGEYGVHTYEQGKSLEEEFCKLTKLRTLKIQQNFDLPDGSEGLSQAKGFDNYVGTLLSSCNLYDLYITKGSNGNTTYPRSLDSWRPAASCSLQKLCMKCYAIYNVPNWMGSLGNLVVLTLDTIICLRPEDVDILGAIPSLLFLELSTTGGSNGRIIIAHRSNGFRCLKYFSMRILYCGTSLEFEAGSMPKLEHVKLMFFVHEMECMNGASSLGVQHLSALSKLEVEIHGNCLGDFDLNYDPTEDKNDGPVRYVANAINDAALALPNRPTVRFVTVASEECNNFKCCLREQNQMLGGLATQWLKIWQIEDDQTEQAKDGETEQEDDADEEEQ